MAAHFWAFTSSQAERLCRDQPPSAKPKSHMAASRPEADVHKRSVCEAGPALNYSDVPEAALPGGAGPLSRMQKRGTPPPKSRVKNLGLPVLAEIDEDHEVTETASQSPDDPEWMCKICTFANHGLLQRCEICKAARTAEVQTCQLDVDLKVVESHHWPSLLEAVEAWTACEVSSTGSSWLDLMGPRESDDETDAVMVTAAGPQETRSWVSRAKAAAAGPTPKVPARGVAVPPLWAKVHKDPAGPVSCQELVLDLNWDDLDEHRHWRQVSRDIAQSRRVRA